MKGESGREQGRCTQKQGGCNGGARAEVRDWIAVLGSGTQRFSWCKGLTPSACWVPICFAHGGRLEPGCLLEEGLGKDFFWWEAEEGRVPPESQLTWGFSPTVMGGQVRRWGCLVPSVPTGQEPGAGRRRPCAHREPMQSPRPPKPRRMKC